MQDSQQDEPLPPRSAYETVVGPHTDRGSANTASGNPHPPAYIYAIGQVQPRFPSLAVEKEFAQIVGRADTAGLTDREALQRVLADGTNRYIARRLCWVLLVENLETYVLMPRDPADLDLLVDAVRAHPGLDDLDVVVGQRGPTATPELCGGLAVPLVAFEHLWSFPREALLAAIPRPESSTADNERFETIAAELFDRIMQLADNTGATDEHRAINYLAVRYPPIYARTVEAYDENTSLSSVEVRSSRLAGVRNIVDVIFAYTHRKTDVTERFFVRVDVTEEFPFLVSPLSSFYER